VVADHDGLKKDDWLNAAIRINNFHIKCVKASANESEYHSIRETARLLSRSTGSISQNLLIASWHKTYPKQIEACESANEALEFIRDKKRELRIRD